MEKNIKHLDKKLIGSHEFYLLNSVNIWFTYTGWDEKFLVQGYIDKNRCIEGEKLAYKHPFIKII